MRLMRNNGDFLSPGLDWPEEWADMRYTLFNLLSPPFFQWKSEEIGKKRKRVE